MIELLKRVYIVVAKIYRR